MRTVLIAEDDPNDTLFLQMAHERTGLACNLQFVKDGDAVVDYLSDPRHRRPRFVILDIKMPKRSGHEVLEWIRSSDTSRFLPVVMLSSSPHPGDVDRAYRTGANAYFQKTSDLGQTRTMLEILVKHWIDFNLPYPAYLE